MAGRLMFQMSSQPVVEGSLSPFLLLLISVSPGPPPPVPQPGRVQYGRGFQYGAGHAYFEAPSSYTLDVLLSVVFLAEGVVGPSYTTESAPPTTFTLE